MEKWLQVLFGILLLTLLQQGIVGTETIIIFAIMFLIKDYF